LASDAKTQFPGWKTGVFQDALNMSSRYARNWYGVNNQVAYPAGARKQPARKTRHERRYDNRAVNTKSFPIWNESEKNLLRIVDNQRYPAWFEHRGEKYKLAIEKIEHESI